jgi:hypothetical protein
LRAPLHAENGRFQSTQSTPFVYTARHFLVNEQSHKETHRRQQVGHCQVDGFTYVLSRLVASHKPTYTRGLPASSTCCLPASHSQSQWGTRSPQRGRVAHRRPCSCWTRSWSTDHLKERGGQPEQQHQEPVTTSLSVCELLYVGHMGPSTVLLGC